MKALFKISLSWDSIDKLECVSKYLLKTKVVWIYQLVDRQELPKIVGLFYKSLYFGPNILAFSQDKALKQAKKLE